MVSHEKYTELLQWHRAVEHFDYDPVVDWAIDKIEKGIEIESILILASFSKPVDSYEVKPYISDVLKDLELEEMYDHHSVKTSAHYYLELILSGHQIRKNLAELYQLCNNSDHANELTSFYLLYHAWIDLEETGINYYYDGVDLNNISQVLTEQAQKWINKHIHNVPNITLSDGLGEELEKLDHSKTITFFKTIKNLLSWN